MGLRIVQKSLLLWFNPIFSIHFEIKDQKITTKYISRVKPARAEFAEFS
jgi:hypothetical protein